MNLSVRAASTQSDVPSGLPVRLLPALSGLADAAWESGWTLGRHGIPADPGDGLTPFQVDAFRRGWLKGSLARSMMEGGAR